ncbi:hypothetical protein ACPA0F_18340 [Solibacillus silvestris]
MQVLTNVYINSHNKFIAFLDNPIVQNALQNTYERVEESLVHVSTYDLQEVAHLIHPRFKGNLLHSIGEELVFWLSDNKICFS